MGGAKKKTKKKGKRIHFFTHFGGISFFLSLHFFYRLHITLLREHTHTHKKRNPLDLAAQKLSSSSSKKTPQPRKRYEKKAVVVVRATFWEHRSAWIRDGGFRARVILESPRRGSFRFVAFRLVFLPRARGQMMFFEKGCILGLRKRGGGGSMSSFPGRDSADANVGRKVRAFTRAR